MPSTLFSLLYLVCLGLCLGAVELVKHGWDAPPPPTPPQQVESVAIAMPPRPDGVRKVSGDGEDAYRYTEQGCLKLDGQYRDICFHQLARQRAPTDLDGALDACTQVADTETGMECVSDVAELHSTHDRDRALQICPTIPKKKWSDQCVFGIALAYSTTDSEWAFDLCSQAGQWDVFCRHDVNGEIAVVNVDLALEHCHEEEGELLQRKTCWHGIGKYIARVDVDRAFAACERVPDGPDGLYRENCFHGVGWGASETAGAEFVGSCGRAGKQQDSCLLGVAYNLKRFDQQGALEICAKVRRADLSAQCDRFVGRGAGG